MLSPVLTVAVVVAFWGFGVVDESGVFVSLEGVEGVATIFGREKSKYSTNSKTFANNVENKYGYNGW